MLMTVALYAFGWILLGLCSWGLLMLARRDRHRRTTVGRLYRLCWVEGNRNENPVLGSTLTLRRR